MMNELFVCALAGLFLPLLLWGFRVLPRQGRQILATVPIKALGDGQWQGLNLTWYGLLSANAYLVALTILLILLTAAGIELRGVLLTAVLLLALCVPASRWVARLVEGKAHTFTVGGAVFVGIIVAPWVVLLVNWLTSIQMPILISLAAMAIAYTFGEGLGRLACISFGCCYGKPLSRCSPTMQKLFRRMNFRFYGETRKAAYEGGLEGQPTLPVQGLTAGLYVLTGLAATELFLHGFYPWSFLLCLVVTQGWRILSEFLRADYRGNGRISAYQIMGLAAIPYGVLIAVLFALPVSDPPLILRGMEPFRQPLTLIFLQLVWIAIFLRTGRSSVTGARLNFHVHHDRI